MNLYRKKGILYVVIALAGSFFLLATLGYLYIYQLLPGFGIKIFTDKHFKYFIQSAVLGYVQYSAYGILYFYIRENFKREKELRIVTAEKLQKELETALHEQEKLRYEYAFLRSQVNPHFLVNTLNVLYSHAEEHSEVLAANIKRLSDILSYSLEATDSDMTTVPAEKEIMHLRQLIEIIVMRFGTSRHIDLQVNGEVAGHYIPPLTFITFVENALKYGDLKSPSQPLQIFITAESQQLHFFCRNRKNQNLSLIPSYGIGLKNLTRRLNFILATTYKLDVSDEEELYTISLVIYK
ncbi:hypothetical protein GCM10023313_06140 [Mucilaginibacter defluvii]|uniref:Signal transduction histidine kinase internal region domain-containing protein n=2 Tax=Mucilaginibacter defluvii TaxID=1196019 RepID=A0ABP9FND0_9SPHI